MTGTFTTMTFVLNKNQLINIVVLTTERDPRLNYIGILNTHKQQQGKTLPIWGQQQRDFRAKPLTMPKAPTCYLRSNIGRRKEPQRLANHQRDPTHTGEKPLEQREKATEQLNQRKKSYHRLLRSGSRTLRPSMATTL